MCDKDFPKDSFKLNYCFNRYKTQGMCYKFVDDFLPMLKLIFDWLITNKKIKKFYNALFADDDTLFFDEDSDNLTFSSNKIGIFIVDLSNINLDVASFSVNGPKTIIYFKTFCVA